PAVKRAAAISSASEAQVVLWLARVFFFPPDVIPSTTNAPESADMIIKLQINIMPSTFKTRAKANFSKNTYNAVETFSPTAVANDKSHSIKPSIVVPPKADNQYKVTIAVMKRTPRQNSQMYLSLALIVIKV